MTNIQDSWNESPPTLKPTFKNRQGRKVVICGSFKRDLLGLEKLYCQLQAQDSHILSPLTLNFERADDGFVRESADILMSSKEIENRHLFTIAHADEVWIHAPNGYIGLSTSLEIGYAIAHNKPLFCSQGLADHTLREYVALYELPPV